MKWRFKNFLKALLHISVLGLLILTLYSFLEPFLWSAHLAASFHIQYAVASLVLLIALFFAHNPLWSCIAGLSFLANVAVLASCFIGKTPVLQTTNKSTLKVMVLNLLTSNQESVRVRNYIQKENPDVIALMEIDDRWHRDLSELNVAWPHQAGENRIDNCGIRLMSRFPLTQEDVLYFPESSIPYLLVKLEKPSPVTLMLVHTLPPSNPLREHSRNSQMDHIVQHVRLETRPVVVLADFNVVPWTQSFRSFVKKSGLSHFPWEQGLWPTRYDGTGLLGIPIDYILAKDCLLRGFKRSPDLGSDHRAISAEVEIPVK